MRRQVLAWRWLLAWKRAWALRRLLSLAGVAGRAGSTTSLSFSKPISKTSLFYQKRNITGPRISGGGRRELARDDRSPLHPLDGRREAPDRLRMIHSRPRWRGAKRSAPSTGMSCAAEPPWPFNDMEVYPPLQNASKASTPSRC